MSDKMTPITFKELLNQAIKEYKREKTIYYVPVSKERIKSPIGPAAGPHTQLAQNILAAYAGGANHFELKTVQVLEGKELGILKPCIYVEGEAYNTEWSTELTVQEALEEYIKAWFLLKLISKEFNFNDENDFVFYMSVGYDLKGIKSKKIDNFIEGLKDASNTEIWKECKKYSLENLDQFENVTAEYIENITPNICNTITLSTMHGCLPEEIEKIAEYLLNEKELSVYIKCNPTLVGYDKAKEILKGLGYDYVVLSKEAFEHDISFKELTDIIRRLIKIAENKNLVFGVKLTNTFPVKITRNELQGNDMYMSGPPLYPFSINVAAMIAKEFNGDLPISYSGGADVNNIKDILDTGIYPVTVSTLLLKQGGYKNITRLNEKCKDYKRGKITKINVEKLEALASKSISDFNYSKNIKKKAEIKGGDYSEFCSKCKNCVDVCPNRSNKLVNVDGKKYTVHIDDLCNECGNCALFCIYNHSPYKEKFTIFSSKENFDNSKNNGVYLDKDMFLRTNKRDVSIEEANEYKKIYKVTRRDI